MSVDPRDDLPPQLRDSVAAATEDYQKELDEGGAKPPLELPVDPPPSAPPEPVIPPEPPAPIEPAAPEPPAVAPEPPKAPEPPAPEALEGKLADLQADVDRLTQANTVLRSKYGAEVPRLTHQLRARDDENAALKREVDSLKQQAAAPVAPDTLETRKAAYGLTEDELELGDDVVAVAEKIARKMNAETQTKLEAMEQKFGTVETHVQSVGQAKLVQDLTSLRPDWEELNAMPEFLPFCEEVEPMSGLKYQEILDAGKEAEDVMRLDSVFDRFASRLRAKAPTVTKEPKVAVAPVAPIAPVAPATIEEQVVPTQAPTAPAGPDGSGKRTYTEEEYKKLSDNVTKGRYPPLRAAEISKELDAAWSEGRVGQQTAAV
jgi:hypothetical protein